MFLVRSIFWLTVAFLVIKPTTDIDPARLSNEAIAAGQQLALEQVRSISCDTLQCVGGQAVIAAALSPIPSAAVPMHPMPAADPVPLPRRRPDQAG